MIAALCAVAENKNTKQETKSMKKKTGFRIGDSLSTVHRSLFTLLTLSLLAALAPRAEATVGAAGGTVTNYWTGTTLSLIHI